MCYKYLSSLTHFSKKLLKLLENKKILIPSLVIPKPVSYFAKSLELISVGYQVIWNDVIYDTYKLSNSKTRTIHVEERTEKAFIH